MKLLPALGRRLLYTLPVVWLVVSLVFLLIHLVPGDPVAQMLGEGATPTDLDTLRHQYGLDLPLGQQYLRYWHGVLARRPGALAPAERLSDSPHPAAVSVHVGAHPGRAGDRATCGHSRGHPCRVASRQMARQHGRRGITVRTCRFRLLLWDRSRILLVSIKLGLAARIGCRIAGASGAARHHNGLGPGRDFDPDGAHRHAGRAGAGLHSDRPGQGFARAHGAVSSRAAQRADPYRDAGGTTVRGACWRARSSPKRSSAGRV